MTNTNKVYEKLNSLNMNDVLLKVKNMNNGVLTDEDVENIIMKILNGNSNKTKIVNLFLLIDSIELFVNDKYLKDKNVF